MKAEAQKGKIKREPKKDNKPEIVILQSKKKFRKAIIQLLNKLSNSLTFFNSNQVKPE